jgi:hypothetical protein
MLRGPSHARPEPQPMPLQLTLDFSAPPAPIPPRPVAAEPATRSPRPARQPASPPALATANYLTRTEASAYIRCSPRFLDGLALPFIRKGRCKVYDRVDLDAYMQDDRHRGRAWKEILWPVNVDSTAARIRGTGGSTSFSRTDAAYAKALGVSIAPMPRPAQSA